MLALTNLFIRKALRYTKPVNIKILKYINMQISNTEVFEMTFSKNAELRTTYVYLKRFSLLIPTAYISVSQPGERTLPGRRREHFNRETQTVITK